MASENLKRIRLSIRIFGEFLEQTAMDIWRNTDAILMQAIVI